MAPIHVNKQTKAAHTQNTSFFTGENFLLRLFFFIVSVSSTKIEPAIATTPPSFEGMARRIA